MPVLVACLLVAGAIVSDRVQDDADKEIASKLARQTVLKFLEDQEKFEIDDEDFQGEATVVDAEENLKAKIKDLQVGYGTASATVLLLAPFRVEGKLDRDEEKLAVSGEVDMAVEMKMIAQITELDGKVRIRSKCEELKCEAKEVRDLDPPELSGGKRLIEEVCDRQSDTIQSAINDWLDENVIEPNEE